MPSRERQTDRAEFDAKRDLGVLGRELRTARLTLGLTMAQVGRAAGVSGQQVSRLEHGMLQRFDAVTLSRALAAVGLMLSMRVFPTGAPIRDVAHARLLDRVRKRLASPWRWHLEVPVIGGPDRRAWDGMATLGLLRVAFEAETRLYDVQAQMRKIMAKFSGGDATRVILVLADTRHNRAVLAEVRELLRADFPLDTKSVMAALAAGRDPGANGIVII
jgi:transcriptional regulator with XRE-family HTH domain